MQPNIEALAANLKNLEDNIKALETKAKTTKTMKMYPGHDGLYRSPYSRDKKMYETAPGLNTVDFLAIFQFSNTGLHCKNAKFNANREIK